MPVHRRNLYILCGTIFLAAVSWNQVIPLLPQFLDELGVATSVAFWSGLVFAAQAFASIFMQPFWGHLGDRVGRKPMVVRAGLFLALIYFLTSICRTSWQLALMRFMNGALTGFIPGSLALIATNTPEELSGRYVATAQSASAVGGIIGPVVGSVLAALLGIRGSLRLSALLVLGATMLVLFLVREENKPAVGRRASILADLRETVRFPSMPLILGVAFLGASVNAAIQPILALHLPSLSGAAPRWMYGAVYALPGLAFVLFALFWTRAGERWTRRRAMTAGLAGVTVCLFFLSVIRSIWLFAAIYFASGIFIAALAPNAAALMAECVPAEKRGQAYGIWQAANTLGAFVAPLAAGYIGYALDLKWVFASWAAVMASGTAMLLAGRRPKEAIEPGASSDNTAARPAGTVYKQ